MLTSYVSRGIYENTYIYKNKFNIIIIINESFMLIKNTLTKAMCIKQHSSALFFHNTFVHNLLLI